VVGSVAVCAAGGRVRGKRQTRVCWAPQGTALAVSLARRALACRTPAVSSQPTPSPESVVGSPHLLCHTHHLLQAQVLLAAGGHPAGRLMWESCTGGWQPEGSEARAGGEQYSAVPQAASQPAAMVPPIGWLHMRAW